MATDRSLDGEEVVQLKRLAERKSRIDEQIKFLTSLPKIQPFEPVAPARSTVEKKECETWWGEHDRIEQEAVTFRGDELALMKKVAKGKTSNMSREDTDLVEVTLKTLEAFSRLEHLLRTRRKQLEILKLRLHWDTQMENAWKEHRALQADIPAFLAKVRWQRPPAPRSGSPRLRSNSNSSPFSTPTLARSRKDSHALLRSSSPILHGRKESPVHVGYLQRQVSNSSLSATASESSAVSVNGGSPPSRAPIELNDSAQATPVKLPSHRRTSSSFSPASPTGSPSINLGTPSTSAQSRSMRAQAFALQLSTISTRVHTFSRAVPATGVTMDRMLDCGLHMPDPFLDEQDALEAALKGLRGTEAAKFLAEMVDQYKAADEVWWQQRALEGEAEALGRDVDILLAKSPDVETAKELDEVILSLEERVRALDRAYGGGEPTGRRAGNVPLPDFDMHADQQQTNASLLGTLRLGHSQMEDRLATAKKRVAAYRFAAEALARALDLRSQMEACLRRLMDSSSELLDLPGRPNLLHLSCLAPVADVESAFETRRAELIADIGQETADAKALLMDASQALVDLQKGAVDPNVKRDVREVTERLSTESKQAVRMLEGEQKEANLLMHVRREASRTSKAEDEVAEGTQALRDAIESRRWTHSMVPTEGVRPSAPLTTLTELRGRLHQNIRPAIAVLLPLLQPTYSALHAHFDEAQARLEVHLESAAVLDDVTNSVDKQRLSTSHLAIDMDSAKTSLSTLKRRLSREFDAAVQPLSADRIGDLVSLDEEVTAHRRQVQSLIAESTSRVVFVSRPGSNLALPIDLDAQDDSVRLFLNELVTDLLASMEGVEAELSLFRWACSARLLDQSLHRIKVGLEDLEASTKDVALGTEKCMSQASKPPFVEDSELDRLAVDLKSLKEQQAALHRQLTEARGLFESWCGSQPASGDARQTAAGSNRQASVDAASQLDVELSETLTRLQSRLEEARALSHISRRHFEARARWRDTLAQVQADADASTATAEESLASLRSLRKDVTTWKVDFQNQIRSELVDLPPSLPHRSSQLDAFDAVLASNHQRCNAARLSAKSLQAQKAAVGQEILDLLPEETSSLIPCATKLSDLDTVIDAVGHELRDAALLLSSLRGEADMHAVRHRRRLERKQNIEDQLTILGSVASSLDALGRTIRQDMASAEAAINHAPSAATRDDNFIERLRCEAGARLNSAPSTARLLRDARLRLDQVSEAMRPASTDFLRQEPLPPPPRQAECKQRLARFSSARQTLANDFGVVQARWHEAVVLFEMIEVDNDTTQYEHAWTDKVVESMEESILRLKDVLGAVLVALKAEAEEVERLGDLVGDVEGTERHHDPSDLHRSVADLHQVAAGIGPRISALAAKVEHLQAVTTRLQRNAPSSSQQSFEGLRVILRHGSEQSQSSHHAWSALHLRISNLLSRLTLARESSYLDELREAVSAIDTDEWHHPALTEHSAMPEQRHIDDLNHAVSRVHQSLSTLNFVHPSSVAARDDVASAFRRKRSSVEACSAMCTFGQSCGRCDDAFSHLLDAIDEADETSDENTEAQIALLEAALGDASGRLSVMKEASTAAPSDSRTQFHSSRLIQTWDELSAMARDELERLRQPRRREPSQDPPDRRRTLSTLSTPSQIPRRRTSGQHNSLRPPPSSGRSSSRLSTYSTGLPSSTPATRSSGRSVTYGGSSSRLKQSPSTASLADSVISRPRRSLGSSMNASTSTSRPPRPNTYRAHPHRTIDRLVGNVVNRLPMEVKVKALEEDEGADKTGRYWIGEKLYFCRILRSQTVMVRIGGGWSELSRFIFDHYKHEFAFSPPASTVSSPIVTPHEEKWISAASLRRSAAEEPSPTLARKRVPSMLSLQAPQITPTPPEAIRLFMRPANAPAPSSQPRNRPHWRP